MHAPARPYALAGAALAATSLIIVTPVATRAIEVPLRDIETRLVDSESILNVPINLFYDLVNIPYNEVQALDATASALFFSGPWNANSATNILGIDPGDPGHFEAVTDLLLPFPALSGMGSPEYDWTAGLGQQLAGFVAAELPASAVCGAESCLPIEPTSPITGLTLIDFWVWIEQLLTGQEKFPLVDNWLQVPISELLNGYTYEPSAPGSVDPSGPATSFLGLLGTGPGNAMPWSGSTYTLQPWVPVENFLNSLMAAPPTDGVLGTGIEVPTLTEFAQSIQALFASSVVAFDLFTPGSIFCPGYCKIVTDLNLNYPQLVQDISKVMPGNPIIDQWLTAYQAGTANVPTEAQIVDQVQGLQQRLWDFGNPSPPTDWTVGGFDLSRLAPFFQTLWTDLGIHTGHGTEAAATASLDPTSLLSGSDLSALSTELTALLGGGASELSSQLSADLSALLTDLGTTLPANLAMLPADLLSLF